MDTQQDSASLSYMNVDLKTSENLEDSQASKESLRDSKFYIWYVQNYQNGEWENLGTHWSNKIEKAFRNKNQEIFVSGNGILNLQTFEISSVSGITKVKREEKK